MIRRIVLAAVAGTVVLFLYAFVVNAGLGLQLRVGMRRPANMEQVYQVLRANLATPGGYIVHSAANDLAPTDDPVFGVRTSGVGHAWAGRGMILELLIGLASCALAATLLSMASERVRSSYRRRVLFVAIIGAAFAVQRDLPKFGIGGYPLESAVLLAASTSVAWLLVALAIGGILRPDQGKARVA